MKWLIISDSHGLTRELEEIIGRHKNEVERIIHCGDSELHHGEKIFSEVIVVQGNCDWKGEFPEEHLEQIENERLYVTHGHRYQVKTSYVPITYRGEEVGATIVCFGHSHVATAFMENNVVYINPGSIRYPRQRKEKTYAICEINDRQVFVRFFEISGRPMEPLAKTFQRS